MDSARLPVGRGTRAPARETQPQKRLGHSKPPITLDTYTHLWPNQEDTTRDAVEAVLGSGVPSKCPQPLAGGVYTQVRTISQR